MPTEEIHEGYTAWVSGASCPYRSGTDPWLDWHQGFEQASFDNGARRLREAGYPCRVQLLQHNNRDFSLESEEETVHHYVDPETGESDELRGHRFSISSHHAICGGLLLRNYMMATTNWGGHFDTFEAALQEMLSDLASPHPAPIQLIRPQQRTSPSTP